MRSVETPRHIGLFGATSIGVGAIVGGGILALAGAALQQTGAGALLAFALNGLIAGMTALSFAELSTAFPHSGGPYAFARRIVSVDAAFAVGWIVWFASIVASVLYALGFAAFAVSAAHGVLDIFGLATPEWVSSAAALTLTAAIAATLSSLVVARLARGGGSTVSVAKVIVFVVLIAGGIWVWMGAAPTEIGSFLPLLPRGTGGLFQAMGYTFIALQGFDLIAAVAGEVREPRRTIPLAMFLALGIALIIYLPLLAIVLAVGVPAGVSLAEFVGAHPETVIAEAARNYLGPSGFWLVVFAGLLSMISALLANVYAASRIAQAMARDRTLPSMIESTHRRLGTPIVAVVTTALILIAILVFIHDVASAGAASSLIFLIAFSLVHVLCIVARRRMPNHGGFRVPFWPGMPIVGALTCGALAIFQGVTVPDAGLVAGSWLAAGGLGYLWLFARRARVQDAIHEVVDTDLLELRGRSPLVLVPVENSANAGVLALLGACVSPTRVGRVLMLNVVPPLQPQVPQEFAEHLEHTAALLRDCLSAAVHAGARTQALATISHDPWREIERVARVYRCASLLVGMAELSDAVLRGELERLASSLPCDFIVARIPLGWRPEKVKRALVPIRGGPHNALRARLLASLRYRVAHEMEVVYLLVLPTTTTAAQRERRELSYVNLMRTEASAPSVVRTVLADDVGAAIVAEASACDLLILGLSRVSRTERVFGEVTRKIIATADCAALVISERG